MGGAQYQLNTKGCCFFCLKNVKSSGILNESEYSRRCELPGLLFKYLDMGKVTKNLVSVLALRQSSPAIVKSSGPGLVVKLCRDCGELCSKAVELVKGLELIEIELGYYLDKIQTGIKDGSRCPSRMKRYSRRMKVDPGAIQTLETLSEFRKQFSNMCSAVVSKTTPQVSVKRENLDGFICRKRPTKIKKVPTVVQSQVQAKSQVSFQMISRSIKSEAVTQPRLVQVKYESDLCLESENNLDEPGSPAELLQSETTIFSTEACPSPAYGDRKSSAITADSVTTKKEWNYTRESLKKKSSHIKRKCNRCNKTFAHNSKCYDSHVLKCKRSAQSQVQKTFMCKICQKGFSSKSTLYHHHRYIHLKCMEFKCHFCGRIFNRKFCWTQHLATVHNGIRFSCTFPGCSVSYNQKPTLLRHQAKKHPYFYMTSENNAMVISRKIRLQPSNNPEAGPDSRDEVESQMEFILPT